MMLYYKPCLQLTAFGYHYSIFKHFRTNYTVFRNYTLYYMFDSGVKRHLTLIRIMLRLLHCIKLHAHIMSSGSIS